MPGRRLHGGGGAGKLSPAAYQEAVRRLGVTAAHAAAVEDSNNGLRSAAAAGLGIIAVPSAAFPPDDNALALAGAVVPSLDEVSPQLVAGLPKHLHSAIPTRCTEEGYRSDLLGASRAAGPSRRRLPGT
ncbi:HAD-IA family hydrolase [Pseudonocardia xinjiangensis]|uniref:HAD-IA family hydrolase n=1 Tax=Pseudonocardia xinjiangensis TaxID=75289 RepID=UPI003D8B7831